LSKTLQLCVTEIDHEKRKVGGIGDGGFFDIHPGGQSSAKYLRDIAVPTVSIRLLKAFWMRNSSVLRTISCFSLFLLSFATVGAIEIALDRCSYEFKAGSGLAAAAKRGFHPDESQ